MVVDFFSDRSLFFHLESIVFPLYWICKQTSREICQSTLRYTVTALRGVAATSGSSCSKSTKKKLWRQKRSGFLVLLPALKSPGFWEGKQYTFIHVLVWNTWAYHLWRNSSFKSLRNIQSCVRFRIHFLIFYLSTTIVLLIKDSKVCLDFSSQEKVCVWSSE